MNRFRSYHFNVSLKPNRYRIFESIKDRINTLSNNMPDEDELTEDLHSILEEELRIHAQSIDSLSTLAIGDRNSEGVFMEGSAIGSILELLGFHADFIHFLSTGLDRESINRLHKAIEKETGRIAKNMPGTHENARAIMNGEIKLDSQEIEGADPENDGEIETKIAI